MPWHKILYKVWKVIPIIYVLTSSNRCDRLFLRKNWIKSSRSLKISLQKGIQVIFLMWRNIYLSRGPEKVLMILFQYLLLLTYLINTSSIGWFTTSAHIKYFRYKRKSFSKFNCHIRIYAPTIIAMFEFIPYSVINFAFIFIM